jgi:type I restriction enzyme R subunit
LSIFVFHIQKITFDRLCAIDLQVIVDMEKDENLRTQAKNNSREHFKCPFNDAFMSVVVDRMMQNKEFCERVLDDEKFRNTIKDLLVGYV